jgi:superfamily II DNA or RNA helicase
MRYQDFIKTKQFSFVESGFDPDLTGYGLFDFQRDIVRWACNRGKAAILADTGMGKTFMQLAWADQVVKHTGLPVILLAPLAVAEQTVEEAAKFGIDAVIAKDASEVNGPRIYVTNYEKIHRFDVTVFSGVVLDESSILKGVTGKTRRELTDSFSKTPYRLSCTATPSPNDLMEFGTQSEFLGIMSQVEMLAMFFIHDGGDTSKWRLKGHGRTKFWEWLSTWAVVIRSPRDLGYSAKGYDLPELVFHSYVVESGQTEGLLPYMAQGLSDRNKARKDTVDLRIDKASEIANNYPGQSIIWCHLNEESEKLENRIANAVQVFGSQSPEKKAEYLLGFSHGTVHKLVTKPSIGGYGMNWQNCNHVVFVGLSDSFEQYYQAVRRCWRFGQTKPVHVHIISADSEGAVVANIKRKEDQHKLIADEMVNHLKNFTLLQLGKATNEKTEYNANQKMEIPRWVM